MQESMVSRWTLSIIMAGRISAKPRMYFSWPVQAIMGSWELTSLARTAVWTPFGLVPRCPSMITRDMSLGLAVR